MIKYLNIKNICMSFILLGVVVLQACSGSEEGLPENNLENSVFISAEVLQASGDALLNSFFYTINRSPSEFVFNNGEATEITGRFTVKTLHPAANDIKVQFELDNSLITSAYNLLPDDVEFMADKYELTIPKGKTVSDDHITLSISSESIGNLPIPNYYDGNTYAYMSPVIKISSVSGGVDIAGNAHLTTASIAIKGRFSTNLMAGSTTVPSGVSVTAKTGWAATINGTPASATDNGYLFDNAQVVTNYVTIPLPFPATLEVDMQSVQEGITGIRLRHSARDFHASSVNVYIKESASEEYKLQGPTLALSRPSSATPWAHNIRFANVVNARYIKLEFPTAYSSAPRITEFDIYLINN